MVSRVYFLFCLMKPGVQSLQNPRKMEELSITARCPSSSGWPIEIHHRTVGVTTSARWPENLGGKGPDLSVGFVAQHPEAFFEVLDD